MKKFNFIFAGAMLVYISIALLLLLFSMKDNRQDSKAYLVEVNRMMHDIERELLADNHLPENPLTDSIIKSDINEYGELSYITKVSFLPKQSEENN